MTTATSCQKLHCALRVCNLYSLGYFFWPGAHTVLCSHCSATPMDWLPRKPDSDPWFTLPPILFIYPHCLWMMWLRTSKQTLKPLCTNPELQAPPRPWRQEIQLQGLSSCPTQNGSTVGDMELGNTGSPRLLWATVSSNLILRQNKKLSTRDLEGK